MSDRFHYSGPATIDGVEFPDVYLHELPPETDGSLRLRGHWEGETSFPDTITPAGFPPDMDDALTVQLPDGRHGQAYATNISYGGSRWDVEFTGVGPPPGIT